MYSGALAGFAIQAGAKLVNMIEHAGQLGN